MTKLLNAQIIVTDRLVGKGVADDPCRSVTQWFAPDGTLLLERDPCVKEERYDGIVEYLLKLEQKL